MGAWGVGPFENDDALDFLDELSELPAEKLTSRLEAALDLQDEDYLELPEASAAIAAAGLIAVAGGAAFDDLDEDVVELVRTGALQDNARLRALALTALTRVTGESSEWQELWSESEGDAVIADLRSALA